MLYEVITDEQHGCGDQGNGPEVDCNARKGPDHGFGKAQDIKRNGNSLGAEQGQANGTTKFRADGS